MSNLPHVVKEMKAVLTESAEVAAKETGFVQRCSKMTGSKFAQTLVLGWMKNPTASLDELTQVAAALQVAITPQGLEARFTEAAAELMEQVLAVTLTKVIEGDAVPIPLLQRFQGVYLDDSTVIALPKSLASQWLGRRNNRGEPTASLKIQVRFNYSRGQLDGVCLQSGRESDRASLTQTLALPKQALHIADLGYFSLKVLSDYAEAGVYFLTRLMNGTQLYDGDGQAFALAERLKHSSQTVVEQLGYLGQQFHLPCRLIACRVPQEVGEQRRRRLKEAARKRQQAVSPAALVLADWTIIVTNIPSELLSWQEAVTLVRVRWQIELLFKLWKSHGRLDESRSANPWRILCEVYAKLVALVIQHWILLSCCWQNPNRSLTKAVKTIQGYVLHIAAVFNHPARICEALDTIRRCLSTGCRMNTRKSHPNTYQLLLEFD